MKFQLVIEADVKRLVLIPDSTAEALLLGSICDPNMVLADADQRVVHAKVTAVGTADRTPYRKVKELHVEL